jgi:hypothetical protein
MRGTIIGQILYIFELNFEFLDCFFLKTGMLKPKVIIALFGVD